MRLVMLILIVLPQLCMGQDNLVPNSSFEEKWACPDNPPDLHQCLYWGNPNAASSDYYHSCNPSLVYIFGEDTVVVPHAGVPANAFGYQHAHSGDAYVGMYCAASGPHNTYVRDYVQVQLMDSIVPSVRYQVSFFASLADNGKYAISTLGAYLSIDALTSDDVYRFDVVPQILNPAANPLADPDIWVLITDTFSSRYGGERYLTIGNFNTTATSDTVLYNPGGDVSANYAYYYIDDVSVLAIDSMPNNIEEREEDSRRFVVYPNPNNGRMTVAYRLQMGEAGMLRVYSSVGALVHESPLDGSREKVEMDVGSIGSGLYLMTIEVNGKRRHTERISILR
ncbi:MAG: T9SS type A sorting domain-containing protein [Flavobacteriales bacterium]|nr:T9SS type A sorting domain-containing protein [Flavobacteriales bacterium]